MKQDNKFLVITLEDQQKNLEIINFLENTFNATNDMFLNGNVVAKEAFYYIDSNNNIRCISEANLNISRFCGLLIDYKIISFDSLRRMYAKSFSFKDKYLKEVIDLLTKGENIFDEKDKKILKELSIFKKKSNSAIEKNLQKIKTRKDLQNDLNSNFRIINTNFFFIEDNLVNKKDKENEIKIYKNTLQATAAIYELLPFYGGKVSIEEWKDKTLDKYYILEKNGEFVVSNTKNYKNHLSFHSEEEAQEFLKNNLDIVKYYFYGRVD